MAVGAENRPWLAQGDEKRRVVRDMFARIAPSYDRLNGLMSLSLHGRWREAAVATLDLKPGEAALDVCCGTGDFLVPLTRAVGKSGRVVGVDFCRPMLDLARDKSAARLAEGDACALPVRPAAFDAVTVGWGLRNVPDLDAALAECVAALKPGGRFACLDMTRTGGFVGRLGQAVCRRALPLLGRIFGEPEAYAYLPESADRFLKPDELGAAMGRAGLADVRHRVLFFGQVALHWGRRP
jgi:demethylmenaquinone methyltransferase / 2-methoxy-6-polyprenyl-1,4-benzoquinol methylase